MTQPIISSLDASHGFFTRNGGVSQGPYASLNCGLFGRDDPANVAENRARAARALGTAADRLVGLRQVHGRRVITAETRWTSSDAPEADALVSADPTLALGIITADCAPVLFACARTGIVGAAHAGWKGALAGVLEATADAMRTLGATAIEAVIGPCIQQDSYEVSADLHDAIIANDPRDASHFRPGRAGHWHFDLSGYCLARLERAGVRTARLLHDTYADETGFFSHRRRTHRDEGPGGHQLSIIVAR